MFYFNVRKWKCEDCEKEFHQKSLLDLHKARIHGVGELPQHVCYVCGSVFTTKSNLGKHLSRSHGIFKRKEYTAIGIINKDYILISVKLVT